MTSKQLIILLVVLIGLGIIFTAGRMLIAPVSVSPSPVPTEINGVICTMDAKMCPDGSYVGRTGPNCEFAMCPGVSATSTTQIQAKIGLATSIMNVTLKPLEVLEDSRCPVNANCIQAGTVRLRTEVTGNGTTTRQTFTLNQSATAGGKTITLLNVMPAPLASVKIASSTYSFTFEVK